MKKKIINYVSFFARHILFLAKDIQRCPIGDTDCIKQIADKVILSNGKCMSNCAK